MEQDPNLIQTSAQLAARQDRLEAQIAELSAKISVLERQLPSGPSADLASPVDAVPPPPKPGAFIREPNITTPSQPARVSLENRLGSQVFNRVGIIALLIGATWFLKLALDNHWIGATGRVLVGLLAGAGLTLWSERFRRSGFPAFSYSLKAIGSGVLYLTLWAAFQLFHLLPASIALVAMLIVTTWNAYMAWAQDAELLAFYALAGGLATPLLLSTGGNHEIFLFTYILAIDIASVILARLKSWPRLLAAALPATIAYFIGWYAAFYAAPELALTSLFVLLFSATFTAAISNLRAFDPLVTQRQRQTETLIRHIVVPVVNAAFTSLALYSILQDSGHHDLLPWLMVSLSALYLGLTRLPQPPVTAALHLSLAILFFTIAIPLKANGPWITIGWLAEGVALLWISTRPVEPAPSSVRVLRILASASLLLGLGGVFTELFSRGTSAHDAFFNRSFNTALAGLAAFASAMAIAHRARTADRTEWPGFAQIAAGSLIAFNLTAVVAGIVQINSLRIYGSQEVNAALARALAVSAFLMLYGAALLAIGFWQRSSFTRWQALILLVVTIAKTFLYDMRNLSQGYRVLSFLGLGALLMAVSFAYQKDWLSLREPTAAARQPQEPRA